MTQPRATRDELWQEGFYNGILVALNVLTSSNGVGCQGPVYDEIIRGCNRDELLREARRCGDLERSGLAHHFGLAAVGSEPPG